MIVISDNISPRFSYITRFLLGELMGAELRLGGKPADGEAVIVYAAEKPAFDCIHIVPWGLLTETGIRKQQVSVERWEGMPSFFSAGGDLPFDIFSAAFYLISRYEEYHEHEKDMYGRYAHKNSLAFREGFLQEPLVEQWVAKLRELVRWNFPKENLGFRTFRFQPSYDIDHAWCYLRKGILRTLAHFGRDIAALDMKSFRRRWKVVTGKEADPYDIYEWLDALHLRYALRPYYFFPLATRVAGYDRNVSPYNRKLRELLEYHAEGYRTGIHPSWRSGDSERAFSEEIALFSSITGREPEYSRFHYIRFELPEGYRKLIRNGIREDHSMGYGTINGFRASVSSPFRWYDLENEVETALYVHPYCWMDANSYYEQGYTPAQAFEELKHYHDVIKKVRGTMVTVSHNNFLSTEHGFAGWKEVYEIFIDQVVYWDI